MEKKEKMQNNLTQTYEFVIEGPGVNCNKYIMLVKCSIVTHIKSIISHLKLKLLVDDYLIWIDFQEDILPIC